MRFVKVILIQFRIKSFVLISTKEVRPLREIFFLLSRFQFKIKQVPNHYLTKRALFMFLSKFPLAYFILFYFVLDK